MAWGLLHMALNQEAQSALRTECLGYGESLSFDHMDELPYLDATIKEMLRMNPSIPNTVSPALPVALIEDPRGQP
jgi:cytochrome P450